MPRKYMTKEAKADKILAFKRSARAKAAWRKRKKEANKPPRWMGTNEPVGPETDMGQEDPMTELLGQLNKSKSFNGYLKRKVALQKELLIRAQRAMLIMLEPVDVPYNET